MIGKKPAYKAIREWIRGEKLLQSNLYQNQEHRIPKEYASQDDAMSAITEATELKINKIKIDTGKKTLSLKEAAEIIVDTVAMVIVPSEDTGLYNLAIYDYDEKIYTFSTHILNDYLVEILGVTSNTSLSSLVMTLTAKRRQMAIYNPLPSYKIAVGNGIYNCLTKKLEEPTPYITVLSKIKTNYIENAPLPNFPNDFSYDKMINDFANGNEERKKLLGQICKSIITGSHTSSALFIILGKGGDGKSTFFGMIANLIGRSNTAFVNFSEIQKEDKMIETLNKKMMLGMDNDVNLYIKRTALLKSMASHEYITLSRKYLPAISYKFMPVIVQLCNEMPRFSETKDSMRRRVVVFKAENSYYANGTEDPNVEKYTKDAKFLEHVLFKILDDIENPYYADYDDVDRDTVNETLESEDILGQFIDEMVQLNVISQYNSRIPLNHLHAAYMDWSKVNNPGGKQHSIRGFKSKIKDKMFDLGYTYDPDNSRARLQSLQNNNLYSVESFGNLQEGEELSKAIENPNPLKYFKYTHEPQQSSKNVRRKSNQITAIEYFGLEQEISKYMTYTDEDYINNESEYQLNFNPIYGDIKNNNEQIEIELNDINSKINEEEINQSIKNNTNQIQSNKIIDIPQQINAPNDIREIIRQNDVDKIKEYIEWINLVKSQGIETMELNEFVLDIIDLLKQVAFAKKDSHLVMQINQLGEEKQMDKALDSLIKILNQFIE